MNAGDLFEIALKKAKGYKCIKDNTAYNKGSDIEETKTSIKSWNFSLTSNTKKDNKEDSINEFFNNCASDNFSFGYIEDNLIIEYNMNLSEFREFLEEFGKYDKSRKIIRGAKFAISRKLEMGFWFEKRL